MKRIRSPVKPSKLDRFLPVRVAGGAGTDAVMQMPDQIVPALVTMPVQACTDTLEINVINRFRQYWTAYRKI